MLYRGVELTLYLDGLGTCPDDMDKIKLTIDPMPSVDAGNTQTVCENDNLMVNAKVNDASSVKWFTRGDGKFNNANKANIVYTPGAGDLAAGGSRVVVEASSYCGTVYDSVNFDVQ